MKLSIKAILFFIIILVIESCATFELQTNEKSEPFEYSKDKIEHTFYLIGDVGNSLENSSTLIDFKQKLDNASDKSTAIFLGDNIYPKGYSSESDQTKAFAKNTLDKQIESLSDFKGKPIFIPGNHDWYSGLKGLKKQEKYIEDELGKNTFLPEDGCPIEKVEISESIILLIVDSHWYITNWDKYPNFNNECDYKTREAFLNELSSEIKKARGKTTLIALHHPMFTNGPHGGQYSFISHLTPIPIIGTLKNILRKTGGISHADMQNKKYNDLRQRVISLAQLNEKVIFLSGHEHSLQLNVENGLTQIVSGSGSKKTPTRNKGNGIFNYGANGFAILEILTDGSSAVKFFETGKEVPVFSSKIFSEDKPKFDSKFNTTFPKDTLASIYTKEEVNKSGFYEFLWGKRYRETYGTNIKAKIVRLDTLYGGVLPVRKGGGNQSKSLRLEDKNGTQYVMRALRKQSTQYLQSTIFKDQYIGNTLDENFTSKLLSDGFTGAHPYAPFAVADLADAIGVYHTNPKIYYVPKQATLGDYNIDFGDELYMIEEHTSEGHDDKASFGFQNKLENTIDFMQDLEKDEDIVLDEASYIKARLFDMLIGDWDRHQDQWRWIEFEEDRKTVYRPMPRDRDQAFSKMSDGFLLTTAVTLIPSARLLRSYSNDLEDVKGVNVEPYPLDVTLIQNSDKKVWDEQVKIIQENITDEIIDKAFLNIPVEVRDENIDRIKKLLKSRRANLQKISDRYFKVLNKTSVIKGTNKDDWFDIERLPDGKTKVTAYRIKGDKKADVMHDRIYQKDVTKEIWIYALDDKDVFKVYGEGTDLIKVRLIGGLDNDIYKIENRKQVKVYDYKSKKNTFENPVRKKLTDNYETNVYNYKLFKNNLNQLVPTIGFNPDDGVKFGFNNTLTTYNFERNPFTTEHSLSASYFVATSGFDIRYSGEFANVINKTNLRLDLAYYSPNYAINFFGFGNSTPNLETDDDSLDFDFNRVRIGGLRLEPTLVWKGKSGSNFEAGLTFESYNVERTPNRFISSFFPQNDNLFFDQNYLGAQTKYIYNVKDDYVFPTLGLFFSFETVLRYNLDSEQAFSYIIPELHIDHKLIPSGQLVFSTRFRGHFNLNNNFQFFQAAVLGDNTGLRGYRRERFSGQNAFANSNDIRYSFKPNSEFSVYKFGVYAGFDYGRVWIDDAFLMNNNFNGNNWNTSYGGGIFLIAYDLLNANFSTFYSEDGLRVAFQLGFSF